MSLFDGNSPRRKRNPGAAEMFLRKEEPQFRPLASFFERRFLDPYIQEMHGTLEDLPVALKGEGYLFSATANALDIISPHEVSLHTFPVSVGQELLEAVRGVLQRKHETAKVRYLPDYVRTVEVLFPGMLDADPTLSTDLDLFVQELQRKVAQFPVPNRQVYYQYVHALSVLAPERAQEVQMNRAAFELFKNEVDAECQQSPVQYGLWQQAIFHYARLAIVHPQWKKELQPDPKIGESRDAFFQYIFAEAGFARCAELLERLAIIDANELTIPTRGRIHVSRYEDIQPLPTPLPPQTEY